MLDEVIAADALADSEARFERAAVARKAAAAARYLLVYAFCHMTISSYFSSNVLAVEKFEYVSDCRINFGI